MDEKMENQAPEFDLPDITFDDEPQPQTQGEGQAPVQPAPPAQTQAPVALGPHSAQVKAQYEATQRAYNELLTQKKKLVEAGYSVPVEMDAQIAQYAAKLAFLEGSLEDAKRKDAMAAVPVVVQKLVAELSPEVARRVEPELRKALEQAVAVNPAVLNDPNTLQVALQATLGALAMRRLKGGQPAAAPAPTQAPLSAPTPPQPQGKKPEAEMPEVARRFGISESAWRKVADLESKEADIDLF